MPAIHPTGGDAFARMLAAQQAPTPWRLCEEEPGVILDANGGEIAVIGLHTSMTNDQCAEVALLVMVAINTCAGLKAELADPS